jgi:MoxR-like ATPase
MKSIVLSGLESGEQITHLLEDKEHWAIKAALAANRPLLVRGEPGIGKTQLAWAAAVMLNRPLVSMTVDSNTESRELMWTFDAVQRLAEAQIASATTTNKKELQDLIMVKNFVRPGPIWWAFDWNSAKDLLRPGENPPALLSTQNETQWTPDQGVVILIDEIDKAESDVPNGLLEALGYREFTPLGRDEPIKLASDVQPPLIVITTNEERVLPDAFVRRCFVLPLELPDISTEDGQNKFVEHLVKRGETHFPASPKVMISPAEETQEGQPKPLPQAAAELLLKDRQRAIKNQQTPLPGQAEYLDFLRAIMKLADKGEDPSNVFKQVQSFVFSKSSGVRG